MTTLTNLADLIGDEKAIEIAVTFLGMTEEYARFVIAMGRGQVDGDLVVVSENSPEEKQE